MDNPFSLSFGKKPLQYISRISQTEELVNKLDSSTPSSQAYMITGVRGAGKTVMLTTVTSKLGEKNNWIVEEINPSNDMLKSLAAKLCTRPELKKLFIKAKLNLSIFGIDLSIEEADAIFDSEVAMEKMLGALNDAGKKVLVTVDEVTKTNEIRSFCSSFQIFIRKDLPIYLLMTGLYENIYNLQNDKSLTFLYRAPKIYLEPLNLTAIKKSYRDIFKLSSEDSESMAILTKGYPFAYQALGYIKWENGSISYEEILDEYDRYLDEFVYEKIWSELSETEQHILITIVDNNISTVKDIRESLNMSSQKFSVYRDRLKKKSIIDTSKYGKIGFLLPRFDKYIENRIWD